MGIFVKAMRFALGAACIGIVGTLIVHSLGLAPAPERLWTIGVWIGSVVLVLVAAEEAA